MKRVVSFFRPVGALVFRHALAIVRLLWLSEILYWSALDLTATGLLVFGLGGFGTSSSAVTALLINVALWYVPARCAVVMCEMIMDSSYALLSKI